MKRKTLSIFFVAFLLGTITYISCTTLGDDGGTLTPTPTPIPIPVPDQNPDTPVALTQDEMNQIWLESINSTSWAMFGTTSTVIRFTNAGTNYVFTAFSSTNQGELVKAVDTNFAIYTFEYSFFGKPSTNQRGYAMINNQLYFVPTKRAYYRSVTNKEWKYNAFYSETNFDWDNIDTNNIEVVLQP